MMLPQPIPIEIRPGLIMRIYPIPLDLTTQEAERICRIIMAFASTAAKEAK